MLACCVFFVLTLDPPPECRLLDFDESLLTRALKSGIDRRNIQRGNSTRTGRATNLSSRSDVLLIVKTSSYESYVVKSK